MTDTKYGEAVEAARRIVAAEDALAKLKSGVLFSDEEDAALVRAINLYTEARTHLPSIARAFLSAVEKGETCNAGALPLPSTVEAPAALGWLPIETAPKDGTLLLLLIGCGDDREHPLEDSAEPTRTIGFNNFDHDGEDEWKFSGWCWSHDHFTEGRGAPVAWIFPPSSATYEGAP